MAKIRLNDGREIRLDTFFEDYTYSGLLAGRPDEEMNQRRVNEAVELAKKSNLFNKNGPVVLIPPKIEQRPTGITAKGMKIYQEKTGSNVSPPLYFPELPSVRCIAHFMSGERKGYPDDIWSHLCIVWFQPNFGLPIDPDVEREIQKLEWDKLADGFEP